MRRYPPKSINYPLLYRVRKRYHSKQQQHGRVFKTSLSQAAAFPHCAGYGEILSSPRVLLLRAASTDDNGEKDMVDEMSPPWAPTVADKCYRKRTITAGKSRSPACAHHQWCKCLEDEIWRKARTCCRCTPSELRERWPHL